MNTTFRNYIICHLTLSEDLLIEIIHLNPKLPQAVIPHCTVFGICEELGLSARAGCQKGFKSYHNIQIEALKTTC